MYDAATYLFTDKRHTMTNSFVTAKVPFASKAILMASTLFCFLLSAGFKQAPKHPRPFHGTYDLTVTIVDPNPPQQKITVSGTGNATHLGRSDYFAETTIDQSGTSLTFNGTAILTAANGDELHTSFTGTAKQTGSTVTITRMFLIDPESSTGRFHGATGSFTGNSIGTAADTPIGIPNFGDITLEGTINY